MPRATAARTRGLGESFESFAWFAHPNRIDRWTICASSSAPIGGDSGPLNGMNQAGIVRLVGVDPRTDRIGLHPRRIVGVNRRLCLNGGSLEPGLIVPAPEDRGHPAVGIGDGGQKR